MVRGENAGVAVLMNVVPPTLAPQPMDDGVILTGARRRVRLRALWAGEGFPSDVRRVLEKDPIDAGQEDLVVTARRMSPGAVQMLSAREISWADADGFAEISTPEGVYISRHRPRPLPRRETTALAWSPSVDAVAEFVLSRRVQPPPGLTDFWNGVDRTALIAEATDLSQGQVAKVLVALDSEGYTAKFGPERGPTATRELRDRGRLLSDWAGHYARSARKERRVDLQVLSREPRRWMHLVADRLGSLSWATSGWVAADSIAPFSTNVPDMILYVPEDDFDGAVQRLSGDDDVTAVEKGGRIHLRSAPDYVLEFKTAAEGQNVVSPVRVYADLLRVGGRGSEAAEHLREVAIGF